MEGRSPPPSAGAEAVTPAMVVVVVVVAILNGVMVGEWVLISSGICASNRLVGSSIEGELAIGSGVGMHIGVTGVETMTLASEVESPATGVLSSDGVGGGMPNHSVVSCGFCEICEVDVVGCGVAMRA